MNVDQSLSAATAIQRVTNRLALEFMLKGTRIGGWAHGGNLNRSLTYFAIQDANVEHLSRDPKLAWTYADDYPPDNVRRPISVHALAQTLNFSPETVRRHVLVLIEEGACDRIEGQGVIIPKRHLMTPKIQGQRMAIIAAFNQLISDLNAIGFDFAAAPPRNSSISEAVRNRNTAPVLLITRLINAYILRVLMDGIRVLGDFPTNVIYGMILAINTRHITFDPKLTWRFAGADQTPPDDFRTPVSIRQLAAELGMPYSTVQRQVLKMAAQGLCQRQENGFIIQNASMTRPEILQHGLNMHVWLVATLGELAALGLDFRHWETSPLTENSLQTVCA